MTRLEIIARIKVEMDELTPLDALIVSIPNELSKPIDAYIESILDQCAEKLTLIAPSHLVDFTIITDPPVVTGGVAVITLPPDYLAIGSIKFPEWERPVNNLIKETDPLYLRQKNTYTRAGVSKPVAAIVSNGDQKVIECFSLTSDGTVHTISYRAKKTAQDINSKLHLALVYLTTSEMIKIFEKGDLAKASTQSLQNELISR